MLVVAQSGRPDQDQLAHPVAVLHGELGGDVAAEREPDQVDLVEPEEVEQLDIVHDVVVDVVHRRIVGGFAEARMKRKMDPELVGPGLGELEAVERCRPRGETPAAPRCRRSTG